MRLIYSALLVILVLMFGGTSFAKRCSRGCARIYLPVCAEITDSNGSRIYHTFGNDCEYKAARCVHTESELSLIQPLSVGETCEDQGYANSPLPWSD